MKPDRISEEYRASMDELCTIIDNAFNKPGKPKRVGFALLMYNFGEDLKGSGRINYIGNGTRSDVLIALKELVARWEGRYSEPKRTQ